MSTKQWFPLESNPQVMNAYVEKMGLDTTAYSFSDVFSTEDWALEMVPKPVVAVVMLFPIKPESEEYRAVEQSKIENEGQIVSSNVYYMKQTVGNACGTVGILHAIGNARSQVTIIEDSYLARLYARTVGLAPDAIADDIEADTEIEATHSSAAAEGQSEQQEGEVDTHFVCFSHVDGHLYELDGRKAFPINHGPSSADTLLEDACRVVRAFMDRDPEEVKFTIVALCKTPEEEGEDALELKEKKYDKSAQFLMNAFATPFFRLLTVGPKGVISAMADNVILTQALLDSLNVEQAREENRAALDALGGQEKLMQIIGVNPATGLSNEQVVQQREKFGENKFPESPMDSYLELLLGALSDTTLLILIAAAAVSLVIGVITEPHHGWIEGTAIFIAVFLVSNISAGNDYSKQLQFKALENSSAQDERTSVLREGTIERINPIDLVVGDILVLQAGDAIPADCVIISKDATKANESSLTGEPDDLKKTAEKDCFLLSSCLLTEGEEIRAVVIGIGMHSQWGKIKANLVSEAVNTPLQDKLEEMTKQIGYLGMVVAVGTFIALIVSIWARHNGEDVVHGFIEAFIVCVTIVVVAIPEGLPLAVTISLAYSTKKMYQDQCFIRVLAACETMGNATNICSDKTGTLTENRMTVVEGYFGDVRYDEEQFAAQSSNEAVNVIYNKKQFAAQTIHENVKRVIVEQCSMNRTAYLVHKDQEGRPLDRPTIIGNKTEGALIMMIKAWGFDYEQVRTNNFKEGVDKIFSFNSAKKRSTAIVHRVDGTVRLYCKGASEWILKDCTAFLNSSGVAEPMTGAKIVTVEGIINSMAEMALRTLCLAHKDFPNAAALPVGWEENPPDHSELILDCVVGIIDPLRSDVKEAVRVAQAAGVTVRMVTGDNIATAKAIARQCGILTEHGTAIEGPALRKLSPAQLDDILPHLQVVARSSPDDKFLLVTRLNGFGIPETREEWEEKMKTRVEGAVWETDRDKYLPGYKEEWTKSRPNGGDVVGVTGDGTNDAPALKAADVGLAMGITGTKVAQGASDIVILDDKFSSIVRAISWGRCVYDNIRKFLQFQLTVNVVALSIVFIGAVAGFPTPLNAVQLLWVNLVMDTMGALALGTEGPTPNLLERRPYRRTSSLISRPMWRNLLTQSVFQLILLLLLLFIGPQWFGIRSGITCERYKVKGAGTFLWDTDTLQQSATGSLGCQGYKTYCASKGIDCLDDKRNIPSTADPSQNVYIALSDLNNFENICLECNLNGYVHGSIIFNTFIFCQFFNEYTARKIFDEWNCLAGLGGNYVFLLVSIVTLGCQIFLIEVGGEFLKTSPLTLHQWLITIALGAIGLPVGVLMRFIPVKEDPNSFFNSVMPTSEKAEAAPGGKGYEMVAAKEISL